MKTLVVGGTGMLTGVDKELAAQGQVFSLARQPERLLMPGMVPLMCDYTDEKALRSILTKYGPFDQALVWVHRTAPQAPAQIAQVVRGHYWQVLGSAAADPTQPTDATQTLAKELGERYHQIILGFVVAGNSSRWLSNIEISAGVLRAMQSGQALSVVGTVTPWNLHP